MGFVGTVCEHGMITICRYCSLFVRYNKKFFLSVLQIWAAAVANLVRMGGLVVVHKMTMFASVLVDLKVGSVKMV